MPQTPDLTLRETAFLAGVSEGTIEKALQAGVLEAAAAPARFRGGAARFLPIRAVAFFHALKAADLADLALRHKRALWDQLTTLKPGPLQAVEFAPGATLDFERLAAGALGYAEPTARPATATSIRGNGAHGPRGAGAAGGRRGAGGLQSTRLPPRAFAAAQI